MMKGIDVVRITPTRNQEMNPFDSELLTPKLSSATVPINHEIKSSSYNTPLPIPPSTQNKIIEVGTRHYGPLLDLPWILCLLAICPPAAVFALYGTHVRSLVYLAIAITLLGIHAAAAHILSAQKFRSSGQVSIWLPSAVIVLSIAACMTLTWAMVRLQAKLKRLEAATAPVRSESNSSATAVVHETFDIARVTSPLSRIGRFAPTIVLFASLNFFPSLFCTFAAEKNLILASMMSLIFDLLMIIPSSIFLKNATTTRDRVLSIWSLSGLLVVIPFIVLQIWEFLKFERSKKKILTSQAAPAQTIGEAAAARVDAANM
eukprot:GDKJ01017494.1.p1 GENE.GDKJ01017494.1~~GDKJ01017494.1.p1  ORF type:complete len:318 (+),score=44.16 GDKJ01017494.1:143-1096(+)